MELEFDTPEESSHGMKTPQSNRTRTAKCQVPLSFLQPPRLQGLLLLLWIAMVTAPTMQPENQTESAFLSTWITKPTRDDKPLYLDPNAVLEPDSLVAVRESSSHCPAILLFAFAIASGMAWHLNETPYR
ncbi:hypothetical protein BO70DRAFT_5038 [Aspergillus heteromorphus CBS 117.55]|uniref:Uncharacterized protein n=1 Tax=Aspergillus heteromorphus CBS 117.55 TaxID=1448321 RepID=A0A317X3I3_9EURO|nr:uncharacterized protein BO70DRAFT_5038 [Aspergillus heteromorphus CBS 117.55]PWY92182.1 hypothetical protein BO70DRAFT_5038 [Aspergillus heteromorphus CBS 117.55]